MYYQRRPKKKRLSGYRVAKDLGLSAMAVSKWRTGKSLPSPENLERLAKYLDKTKDQTLNFLAREFSTMD